MFGKIKLLLFQNISTRQTVAKNTFWLAVSQVGGRLIRAIIVIYAARVLGAEGWGVFSYAISLIALFTIFADLGIGQILIRDVARLKDEPDYRRKLVSTSFFIKILLLAAGIAIVFFATPFLSIGTSTRLILPIIIFVFIFDVLRQFGFSIIHALEKMEWEAALYLLTNVAVVVFGFVFLATVPTVRSFAFAYAAGTGLGTVATWWALRKHFGGVFSNFSLKIARYIFSVGWPFAIAAILGSLLINTDIVIIGWLRSATDVGLYAAADRIVSLFYVVPTILSSSILPALSRIVKRGGNITNAIETSIGATYMVAFPLVAGGIILGKEVMGLLFGAEYIGAALAFQVLILTLLASFPASIISSLLFIYNKQKSIMIYSAIAGSVNVVLDLFLIPKFGIVGSSLATITSQLLATIYLWHIAKNTVSFSILPRLKKIVVATIIMSAALVILGSTLGIIASIVIGILVYFVSLYALREKLFAEIGPTLRPKTPQ